MAEQSKRKRGSRKPKINRATLKEHISSYFSEYCGATSVHGYQYLGERKRYLIEKLIWLIIIIILWYFCIILIMKSYYKWKASPVIVSFATTEMPISNIPFPAVTICPAVKTNPEIANYTRLVFEKMQNTITPEDELYLDTLNLICEVGILEEMSNLNAEKFIDDTVVMLMFQNFILSHKNISQTWLGKELNEESISYTLTEEGPCMTFNMLNIEEILRDPDSYMALKLSDTISSSKWSLEKGFTDGITVDTFPKRTFVAGRNGGAEFILYTNDSHLDWLCGDALQGFKVVLHHPSELPDLDKHVRVPLDEAVTIGIKPRMIMVSDELKAYTPQERSCYFSDQRPLRYFKSYTQNNCFRECLSNLTLERCGCISFYMPKDEDAPTCGIGSSQCVDQCKIDVGIASDRCDCLPSCTSLEYDVEISQSQWEWRKVFKTMELFSFSVPIEVLDYEKDHVSALSVYYKELQFLPSERHELYSYVDFFSNTGGLLGLFIGFSVTSVIEIIYFLTLRLYCNIRKYGVFSGDSAVEPESAQLV